MKNIVHTLTLAQMRANPPSYSCDSGGCGFIGDHAHGSFLRGLIPF